MIKQLFGDRVSSIRLHPNTLTGVYEATLISILALACARRGLSRIAVTDPILSRAAEMAIQATPAANKPLVRDRFEAVRETFKVYSRIDKPRKRAFLSDFHRAQPGDAEALAAVFDNKDDFIVTHHPRTLAGDLAEMRTKILTPQQLFEAAHEQIPRILLEAIEQHLMVEGVPLNFYEEHLRKSGLEHLIPLTQSVTK